jgi:hypothetical protein
MSVSSSVKWNCQSSVTLTIPLVAVLTPWLRVESDNGLGSRLSLSLLLLLVLGQTLVPHSHGLGVFLLVIRAEEVNIIVILLSSSGCLGGVAGNLAGLGTVCSVFFCRVTRQRGKFRFERGDVLVPAGCVRVLLGGGLGLGGLEGLDIGLGRGVSE